MKFINLSSVICTISITAALAHVLFAQNSPEDYVQAHNVARAEVGDVPISWNATLAAIAEKRAAQRITDCALLEDFYRENIAMSSYALTGVEAVKMWVDEKPYYSYDQNECVGRNCDHYTLVVWNETTNVGCARAQCNNGNWFVSCSYYPDGNWPLERPYRRTAF